MSVGIVSNNISAKDRKHMSVSSKYFGVYTATLFIPDGSRSL